MPIEISETIYRKHLKMTGKTYEVKKPWSRWLTSSRYKEKVLVTILPDDESGMPSVALSTYTFETYSAGHHAVTVLNIKENVVFSGDDINSLGTFTDAGGKRLIMLKHTRPEPRRVNV